MLQRHPNFGSEGEELGARKCLGGMTRPTSIIQDLKLDSALNPVKVTLVKVRLV